MLRSHYCVSMGLEAVWWGQGDVLVILAEQCVDLVTREGGVYNNGCLTHTAPLTTITYICQHFTHIEPPPCHLAISHQYS